MHIEEIRYRLARIEEEADDPESAHGMEDQLLIDFIKHVADTGDSELATKALEVLSVQDIPFPRWCA